MAEAAAATGDAAGLRVFTGGTGRSGTTVACNMLGQHPLIAVSRPREVQFITYRSGLLDLVLPWKALRDSLASRGIPQDDPKRVQALLRDLRGRYFTRKVLGGTSMTGLHRGLSAEQLEAAIAEFEQAWAAGQRVPAARTLILGIMDRMAARQKKPGWVESTPNNVINAGRINQVLPEAKIINLVRDGRDVAASVAAQVWGPDTVAEGLEWWGDRMRRGHHGMSLLPAGAGLTVRMEDLVTRDRDATYQRILTFLEVPDAPQMRAFFTQKMAPEAGHVGRWARELEPAERKRLDARYRELYAELKAAGAVLPHLD